MLVFIYFIFFFALTAPVKIVTRQEFDALKQLVETKMNITEGGGGGGVTTEAEFFRSLGGHYCYDNNFELKLRIWQDSMKQFVL